MTEQAISLHGLTDTQKRLRELDQKMADKAVIRGLRAGARYMLKQVREAAPKKTGRLRKSITVRLSKKNRKRVNGKLGLYISIKKGKKSDDPKGAYYGVFQDQGWRQNPQRGNKQIAGKHFISRTFEANQDAALSVTLDAIKAESQQLINEFNAS